MGIIDAILIAVGLSMDSFAVSITSGALIRKFTLRRVLKIAIYMGVFQGAMPAVGWLIGKSFQKYIESFDHWIAFGLLTLIGGKMIWESFQEEEKKCFNPTKTSILIGLAFATSIDAIIVGVGFGVMNISLWFPVLLIGLVTFLFSFSGVGIGVRFGRKFQSGAELFGGLVLIGLGVKIVLEHTL